jgi:hypothetical protein
MKPGITILPEASITWASAASIWCPTSMIFDPSISTSPLAKLPTSGSTDITTPPLIRMRVPSLPASCGIDAAVMLVVAAAAACAPLEVSPAGLRNTCPKVGHRAAGVAGLQSLHMLVSPP